VGALLAFVVSFAVSLTFNIKGHKLVFAGFSGMIGSFVYSAALRITGHANFAILIGATVVGLYSEIAARVLKAPATVFSIPGILPLVPGIAAYEMIRFLERNELTRTVRKLTETVSGAGAIAFGIMLVTAVFRFLAGTRKPEGKGVEKIKHQGNQAPGD
jgi:uncharacterized membrane protein YjjB (DUF3815 family)